MIPESSINLWKPGLHTKILAGIAGRVFALLSIARPNGYGRMGAILMASIAVILPTLQFRQLWPSIRFWLVVALLAVIQVPLINWARVLAEQYRGVFLLAFGIGDGLFVILVITSTCLSRKNTA
jgi:hypothetical protein